jgi:hypothetical protein
MGQRHPRVDECRFRRPIGGEDRAAHCELLREISGAHELSHCRVELDACEACCRQFPPSVKNPNPVVSSLLYQLTLQIARSGGVAGCDRFQAEQLSRMAVERLPSDEDLRDAPQGALEPSAQSGAVSVERLIPYPKRRSGASVRNWAVGVTTAPREAPTLTRCVESLAHAGWPALRLFVDGPVAIPEEFAGLSRTHREPQIGAWPNYYLALVELMMREPAAQAYMIVQDDVLFARDSQIRDYLEHVLWPGERPGIASLFCSRAYTTSQAGWHLIEGVWTWGALAFVFSQEAAQRFLADRDVVLHRWSRKRNGLADISRTVGQWAYENDIPVYYPTPSLVQHIGEVSAIFEGVRAYGNRRASWFAGGHSSLD